MQLISKKPSAWHVALHCHSLLRPNTAEVARALRTTPHDRWPAPAPGSATHHGLRLRHLSEFCSFSISPAKLCKLRAPLKSRLYYDGRRSANTCATRLTGNLRAVFGNLATLLPLLRTWDVHTINAEMPYHVAPPR